MRTRKHFCSDFIDDCLIDCFKENLGIIKIYFAVRILMKMSKHISRGTVEHSNLLTWMLLLVIRLRDVEVVAYSDWPMVFAIARSFE